VQIAAALSVRAGYLLDEPCLDGVVQRVEQSVAGLPGGALQDVDSEVSTRDRRKLQQLGAARWKSVESTTNDLTYSLGNRPAPFRRAALGLVLGLQQAEVLLHEERVAVRLLMDRRHEIRRGVELWDRPQETRDIAFGQSWKGNASCSRSTEEFGQCGHERMVS
jgi:hypothetical protein